MRLSFIHLLIVGVAIASAKASAQQGNLRQAQNAELASTYLAWQQARDTEEKIGLGERALAAGAGGRIMVSRDPASTFQGRAFVRSRRPLCQSHAGRVRRQHREGDRTICNQP